ncbi:hypothetical protein L1O03_08720 [Corynebacterium uropygiale]|uniref:Uncharacterized protein n=1 Tax=Corynebacterium uropygiale TaxID=1775911 RepID=A0A9X1QQH0_9CORY|nr:hypothetical protein [Corynebacterium uropygiale]MCF4007256.1 hypothetical protein [Corynebacterium uropygiale]
MLELIQMYPPSGPLVFITGQLDINALWDFGARVINVYPSVGQVLRMVEAARASLPF